VHVLSLVGGSPPIEVTPGGYTVHRPPRRAKWQALLHRMPSVHPTQWFPRFAFTSPRAYLVALGLAKVVKALVHRHKVAVISAYHLFPVGLAAAWVSEDTGLPLVTTVFGEIFSNLRLHRQRAAEVRYIVDRSSRVLSCSRHCAQSLNLLGLPTAEVIHYGVDIGRFHGRVDGAPVRQKLGISIQAPVVLFVGRMEPEMGLHTLLASLPDVLFARRDAVAVIVGSSGKLTRAALALAEREPRRVFVVPDVPGEELPRYYAAATIVVAPSTSARACLGLAIAEALASERAVVAARVGGTTEVLSDGKTGLLVPPEDPAALRRAVLALLDDNARRAEMGRRGRVDVERRFNKDAVNQTMQQLYEALVP
jgi:glycosyltransferase involved in cell wall biosynthesis